MSKEHRNDEVAASNMTVGRYQLLLPLGVGGAATVYLARATGIGGFARNVAVKVLHPHLRQDQAYVADFMREARLAAGLRHPNLLPVLDVGDTDAGVFLVMDWVDGCSLSELFASMRPAGVQMPLPVALRMMTDALAGLHAAHELCNEHGQSLGLVHRDVSPHNLLISAAGSTLLSDFGIAKPTAHPGQTRTGVIKGKLGYMAPEQLRGGIVDRRSDVWSAGVTCWEWLAGRRPFEGDDEAQLILDVSAGQVPLLQTVAPALPPALARAVQGALAAHPDERWATADVFRKQLLLAAPACGGIADVDQVSAFVMSMMGDVIESRRERALATVGAPAPGPTNAFSPTPAPPRRWAWAAAAMSAVALVVGLLYWPAWSVKRASVPNASKPANSSSPSVRREAAPSAATTAVIPPMQQASPQAATQRNAVIKKTAPDPNRARPARAKVAAPPLADNPYTKP